MEEFDEGSLGIPQILTHQMLCRKREKTTAYYVFEYNELMNKVDLKNSGSKIVPNSNVRDGSSTNNLLKRKMKHSNMEHEVAKDVRKIGKPQDRNGTW